MSIVEPLRNKSDITKLENYLRIKNQRNYLIFIFGINTGLRISDILKLNVEDVKDKKYLEIVEKKAKKYKRFPLNDKLITNINEYIKNKNTASPLFVGIKGHRLNRSQVYRFLNEACKKCNVEIHIGTHTMRKTFGYHHYKKFNNIAILQKILNHSTPNITLTYIGISQDEIDYTYNNFTL